MLGEYAFEDAKLDLARDQDDASVFEPELFVSLSRQFEVGSILVLGGGEICSLTFAAGAGVFRHREVAQWPDFAVFRVHFIGIRYTLLQFEFEPDGSGEDKLSGKIK